MNFKIIILSTILIPLSTMANLDIGITDNVSEKHSVSEVSAEALTACGNSSMIALAKTSTSSAANNILSLPMSTCTDERDACDGTVRTFSCSSDICGNQSDPQCYICVAGDPGKN